jgi:asparagine synthase (glutamine-hydrolysing)
MSGIAGIARRYPSGVSTDSLGRMAAAIRHRGPDGYGFYVSPSVGFAHVRLSTVDLAGGAQPLANENGRVVVTYDGEIYNHRELRHELEQRGHIFKTRCDTEVLVHAYEEWGADFLTRLNGDFAFAIHDMNRDIVLVACDRFGVRPLFYAQRSGDFYFGSEIKAILATGEVDAAVDPRGIDEIFTFGAARLSRTPFSGVASLEPGTYGIWKEGALWLRHYYELDYPEASTEPADAVEQLDEVMLRSVGMRMRADVPVGAQVSGGFNSSITASLAASASPGALRTFFMDVTGASSNGNGHQSEVADALGTDHRTFSIDENTIAETLPEVMWHAETPLLSSAPVAMYHLARMTKETRTKVVVRGDGADEIFLGSEVFREASVRRFCLRQRTSTIRQRLFSRVFPDLAEQGNSEFWTRNFLETGEPGDPLFSHLPRFLGVGLGATYADEFADALAGVDVIREMRSSLPLRFFAWSPLNQAAFLETTTRLSPYVLGAYGDRMSMAHGVECRFPFLDHRLFEFASALPTRSRMVGLRQKEILRRWASRILPRGVTRDVLPATDTVHGDRLFLRKSPKWVSDHLSPEALSRVGIFSADKVRAMILSLETGQEGNFTRGQPLTGVLSTQLWHHRFVQSAVSVTPLPVAKASVVIRQETLDPSYPVSANRAEKLA